MICGTRSGRGHGQLANWTNIKEDDTQEDDTQLESVRKLEKAIDAVSPKDVGEFLPFVAGAKQRLYYDGSCRIHLEFCLNRANMVFVIHSATMEYRPDS